MLLYKLTVQDAYSPRTSIRQNWNSTVSMNQFALWRLQIKKRLALKATGLNDREQLPWLEYDRIWQSDCGTSAEAISTIKGRKIRVYTMGFHPKERRILRSERSALDRRRSRTRRSKTL